MIGWLDPYLAPAPASKLAGLFDSLPSVGTFVDESARGAIFAGGTASTMPGSAEYDDAIAALRASRSASVAATLARLNAPAPAPPLRLPSPAITSSTSSGGPRAMAVDLSALVAAVSTVGDKVVAFRKADADANLARARLDANARLSEAAIRSGSTALGGVNVSGALGSALPILGLGLGVVVLLKLVKAVR